MKELVEKGLKGKARLAESNYNLSYLKIRFVFPLFFCFTLLILKCFFIFQYEHLILTAL